MFSQLTQARWLRKNARLLFILTLLLTFCLRAASVAVAAPHSDWSSLDLLPEDPPPAMVAVRAYYDDPAQIRLLQAYDVWEYNNLRDHYVLVALSPTQFDQLEQLGFRLEIDDYYTAKLNETPAELPGQLTGIPGYPCYRTVEEQYVSAQSIVANHPSLATWLDVGDSWEKTVGAGGYDMMVLKLTNSAVPGPKPKLFVSSSIHAREYSPAELSMRFAEFLIDNYGSDADVTWLLDYHEIHLMMQANPDGRKHAETGQNWRKNVNRDYCFITIFPLPYGDGADLNRNFQFEWGNWGGSSGDECDPTFRGASPASEPETQSVQNYITSQFPDQRADPLSEPAPLDATGLYIDTHSFSRLVLWPWGFPALAPNSTELTTLGRKFAYFNDYTPQQSVDLYPTDGSSTDFAYGELGVAAYTFELGTEFFQDCATFENQILPDHLPALVYAAKAARTPYLSPAGPDATGVAVGPEIGSIGALAQITATVDDTRFSNVNGSEPIQNVIAAEYYVDVPPWMPGAVGQPLHPVDGSFDSSIEQVAAELDTAGLTPGTHLIYVRGQDALGNWGVMSAAFVDLFLPGAAVDVSLIIDSSGSMVTNDPDDMRKEGAKAFVDIAHNGDGIAVVDFDENVVVPWHMTPLTSDRSAVKAAIDTIDSNGATNIGDALQVGFDQLQAGDPDHGKAAVLLTDGEHNTGPDPTTIVPIYQAAGWPIYTIGLGPDTNPQLLQWIADQTGGMYMHLSDPDDLVNIYNEIIGAIQGGTTVYNQEYPMEQGSTVQALVPISSNQSQAVFLVNWPGSRVDTTLTTPSGLQITPQTVDPNVYHAQGLTYEIYRITNPEAGEWTVTMYGADLPPGGEIVELTVSIVGQTNPPSPLVCNNAPEGFEAGTPPAGWSAVNNVPGSPEWTTIAVCGELGNYTNGDGEAACVNVGSMGEHAWDTELRTPSFSLAGQTEAFVNYQVNYQSWSGVDRLDLDASTDGGATWTTLGSWNDDLGSFQNTPGENIWIDLTAYAGQPDVMLRWRYYNPAPPAPGWYVQIDDLRLGCLAMPPTAVTLDDLETEDARLPGALPIPTLPAAAAPVAASLALAAAAWLRRKR